MVTVTIRTVIPLLLPILIQMNSLGWKPCLTPQSQITGSLPYGASLHSYLINIRKLSVDEAYGQIRGWLSKCDRVRRLDFNVDNRTKERAAIKVGYLPISFNKLKQQHSEFVWIPTSLTGLITNLIFGLNIMTLAVTTYVTNDWSWGDAKDFINE